MNKRKSLGYQMRYVCMMLACLLMVGCQEEELVPGLWGRGRLFAAEVGEGGCGAFFYYKGGSGRTSDGTCSNNDG